MGGDAANTGVCHVFPHYFCCPVACPHTISPSHRMMHLWLAQAPCCTLFLLRNGDAFLLRWTPVSRFQPKYGIPYGATVCNTVGTVCVMVNEGNRLDVGITASSRARNSTRSTFFSPESAGAKKSDSGAESRWCGDDDRCRCPLRSRLELLGPDPGP